MLQKKIKNIIEDFGEEINEVTAELVEMLEEGSLLSLENKLSEVTQELYNKLASQIIRNVASSKKLKKIAYYLSQKRGLKKLRATDVKLQLKTGKTIKIPSYYGQSARKKKQKSKKGPNGKGQHMLLEYWGCIDKASPSYYSYTTMLSVICPSFEVALRVLEEQKINCEYKRIRRLSYKVGEKCFNQRTVISHSRIESLANKRVIVSVDGGKTRTRTTKEKPRKFNTPWREVKLFIIQTLDEKGRCSKIHLPVYDGLIDKPDKVFDLLFRYLKQLEIHKSKEILFISDGANWIWKRVESMFEELNVNNDQITYALDYFHASQHIYAILRLFTSKQISNNEKKILSKRFKNYLYHGKIDLLIDEVTKLAPKRPSLISEVGYFKRYINFMNYPLLRLKKLPCGSGVMESAVRRVINLRFKAPSSFWKVNNVQKLIFLRATFLSKRWNIMISNLTQKNFSLNL